MEPKMTKTEFKAYSMIVDAIKSLRRTRRWKELSKNHTEGMEYTFKLEDPRRNRRTTVTIVETEIHSGRFPWEE